MLAETTAGVMRSSATLNHPAPCGAWSLAWRHLWMGPRQSDSPSRRRSIGEQTGSMAPPGSIPVQSCCFIVAAGRVQADLVPLWEACECGVRGHWQNQSRSVNCETRTLTQDVLYSAQSQAPTARHIIGLRQHV